MSAHAAHLIYIKKFLYKRNSQHCMQEKISEDYKKAGNIAHQALQYGKELIRPGAKLLEVSEKVEKRIAELGGELAFPVQISCDEIAAHYCADPDDPLVFEKQVACLDVGVHVNGAIGDNALTVDLSREHGDLVKASREALEAAAEILGPGVTLGKIGRAIQDAIEGRGFSPVRNLSGHGLDLYNIHAYPQIPNYDTADDSILENGMFIAIEPFATDGAGMIYETERANIFSLGEKRPVRNPITRQVLKEIEKYKGLPFTTRWLARKFPLFRVRLALREMKQLEMLKEYPPLPDKNKGLVSQAEDSFYISDEAECLTK
ncbi:type II methionyl aminopeptidase [Candidatus Woesearchaeota archaeon]|nr:type II methionyl aminopeptidase [Candidatus Woesearchaeota archaeon]